MPDFYERQGEYLENRELLRDFQGFIDDYLASEPGTEASNSVKSVIFDTASDLDRASHRILRDYLSDGARRSSGREKIMLYELSAGLYNLSSSSRAYAEERPSHHTHEYDDAHGEDYPEERPRHGRRSHHHESVEESRGVLEILGGTIRQKVLTLGEGGIKRERKIFDVDDLRVIDLGDNTYELRFEARRKINDFVSQVSHKSITLRHDGYGMLEIYNDQGDCIEKIQAQRESGMQNISFRVGGDEYALSLRFY